jgi:hypothetical protein
MFTNNIDCEIFLQGKMNFFLKSNLIQKINYYGVDNKYDSYRGLQFYN